MTTSKNVLVIGGHGRVALRTLPLLTKAGHNVEALIRKPEYEADIVALGAKPRIAEMLDFDNTAWDELLRDKDVVIWAAGNGGRNGVDQTYAMRPRRRDRIDRRGHPRRYQAALPDGEFRNFVRAPHRRGRLLPPLRAG